MATRKPDKKKPSKGRKAAWDRLTLKQKKFVKAYFETGNATEAARQAGYSPKRARQAGSENVAKRDLSQEAMAEILDKAGLTDEAIAHKLSEGADAKETKFFARDGLVIETRDVAAWGVRHSYLETALKAKGYLRNRVEVTGPGGQPVKFNFVEMDNDDGDES